MSFKAGETHKVYYRSASRWGEEAGTVKILEVKEIPEEQIKWESTSVKDSYHAEAGEIVFQLDTKHSGKAKTTVLYKYKDSEKEGTYFSAGRNYKIIKEEG